MDLETPMGRVDAIGLAGEVNEPSADGEDFVERFVSRR
jgi:hypothetical protein